MGKICVFFGHAKLPITIEQQKKLSQVIIDLIENNNVDTFWLGGYGKFDWIASSTVRKIQKQYPHNHPVLRLAQAATLFTKHELFLDKILECRCLEDIEEIFMVDASDYWTTHYVPSKVSSSEVKRLGGMKCNILGINLVVMIQFAYGSYTMNDDMVDRAQNLIQDLKAESNKFINCWRDYGIRPKTAFEGQALIQISEKYCSEARCRECYIGARAIKDMSWIEDDDEDEDDSE